MNILISCDKNYYDNWGQNFIKTTMSFNPWIKINCLTISETKVEEIKGVEYIYDGIDITSLKNPVAYYQAARFLKCVEFFPSRELVMTIDCDTICTRPIDKKDFTDLCSSIHVQRHQKKDKWMAGLVTYGTDTGFKTDFKDTLLSRPIKEWRYGWDQQVLNMLASKHQYNRLAVGQWLSFGKGRGVFLTLKGDQKIKPKFLTNYNSILDNNE